MGKKYLMSSAQKRMYTLTQLLDSASTVYNMPYLFKFNGILDQQRLNSAILEIIERHEILRTNFIYYKDQYVQVVKDNSKFELEFKEMSEPTVEAECSLFITPFDLKNDSLFRARIVSCSTGEMIIMFDIHHIISDAVSFGILMTEIEKAYNKDILPKVKLQYRQYAQWQKELNIEDQKDFWIREYEKGVPTLELMTDYKRPAQQNFCGDTITVVTTGKLRDEIKSFIRKNKVTEYMFFMSAIMLLLSKYSRQKDIVIGTPVSGRTNIDSENMLGMFINTLAIKGEVDNTKTFHCFLNSVKNKCLSAYKNQDYQFDDLVEALQLERDISRNPAFDVMFLMHNHKNSQPSLFINQPIETISLNSQSAKFDLTITVIESTKGYHINFEYCTDLFRSETMEQMARHCINLIDHSIHQPELLLADLQMTDETEREALLTKFQCSKATFPKDQTIVRLFEEQTEQTPDNIALVFGEQTLTYAQLNARANAIAAKLRSDYGVKPNDFVAMLTERSLEMVVGIFGILKSGGAYVPIDPAYSKERIQFMLDDCKPNAVLCGQDITENPEGFPVISLQDSLEGEEINPERVNTPDDLLYVIYTSGTTGQPKGVMVEHQNLVRLLRNDRFPFDFNETDVWTLFHSYCFDFSVWEIFGSLLNGAKLILLSDELVKDTYAFLEVLIKEKVTILNQVPTSFYNLMEVMGEKRLESLRYVIFGGEALNPSHLEEWYQNHRNSKLVNMYGITETTVHVTYLEIGESEIRRGISDIGTAIPTLSVYIMNGNELCGIGVPGELCVAGAGVTRGYLNRPELTEEKFVENPYGEGRMYRSGDLGRWLPDGTIEYLGRIDDQVKIRGYRIELGEIESCMLRMEEVRDAVVIARENKAGEKSLYGYVTGVGDLNIKSITDKLQRELPDYMVPAYLILLESIPVNRNGKLDKKALPEPEYKAKEYIAPGTKKEKLVADAFKNILGIERISITDNFFDLGGDSIKAIRIMSRIRDAGYDVNMRSIMTEKTPKFIAKALTQKVIRIPVEQGEVTGEVSLTPIQKYFFRQDLHRPSHFNQSQMLKCTDRVEIDALKLTLAKLTEHHDMLRATYQDGMQKIGNISDKQWYVLSEYQCETDGIKEAANQIQSSIELNMGPLLRVGLFHTIEHDYLLVVIHHLVTDGISWRILLEDLETAYGQAVTGKELIMPAKTVSYRTWSDGIRSYQETPFLKREAEYWNKVTKKLSKGRIVKTGTKSEHSPKMSVMALDFETTAMLLKISNHAYDTTINDLLLTALGRAVSIVTGQRTLSIAMEGHGREECVGNYDIGRTVGWFTSIYPIVLEQLGSDIRQDIRNTKNTMRRVPEHGIGYGILGFEDLAADIAFNYLGEFGKEKNLSSPHFIMSDLSRGLDSDISNHFGCAISINSGIQNDVLSIAVNYDESEYSLEQIEQICEAYQRELINVANHCRQQKVTEPTSSDFGEYEWTDEEFSRVKASIEKEGREIERIYPLTPMQEGMLFEKLANESSTQYVIQQTMCFEELDVERIQKAFNAVVSHHDVLRTAIQYRSLSVPRQVLLHVRVPEFKYTQVDGEKAYETLKVRDVKRGFDLERDTLIRMQIVKLSENDYRMILTNHHIIADGWCLSILYKDLFTSYMQMEEGHELEETVFANHFESFVQYIGTKDKEVSLKYWETLLDGYEERAEIQPIGIKVNQEEESLRTEIDLSKEITEQAQAVCAQYGVTVNTLVEACWGLLLQKYNQTEDVVFGKVVSGRNAEVDGIEEMIGLFINTVPVRVKTQPEETFAELLQNLQEQAISGNDHDYCPLVEIQGKSTLGSGLIATLVAFENYYIGDISMLKAADKNLHMKFESAREQIHYKLGLSVYMSETLHMGIMYNTRVYGEQEIGYLIKHLARIVEQVSENPQITLSKLRVTDIEEEKMVLAEFNNTDMEYSRDKTVVQMFEEQVIKTPDKIAVVFAEKEITYAELNKMANGLAKRLRSELHIKADDFVALYTVRSIEMIVGIIGTIKSGAAYVPIDPTHPEERIQHIINDCQPKVILYNELPVKNVDGIIQWDLNEQELYCESEENLEYMNTADNLIYLIYTSGTTGMPKGVMVENRGVINLMNLFTKKFDIDSNHSIGMFHNYIFDGSVWEIMMALLTGSKLVVLTQDQIYDLTELHNLARRQSIDIIALPPQYATRLNFETVKLLITAGSEAQAETLKLVEERYINSYGPTENTVSSTYWEYKSGMPHPMRIPIGKPAPNVKINIMNGDELCGICIPGEICITGDSLARGYLNHEELTSEKFIKNPYGEGLMYRTGDLARWLPDGNIDYLGRLDNQIKIRGYRVELSEIKSIIMKLDHVRDAVVIAREDSRAGQYLCAFIVSDMEIDSNHVKEELRRKVPGYMVPAQIVQIDSLPETRTGKIDVNALPEVEYLHQAEYVPPRNEEEKIIVEVLEYVLREEGIGIYDDFFDLGGHSILLIELSNILSERLGLKIKLVDFMQAMTAAGIYHKYLEVKESQEDSVDDIDWEVIEL